MRRFDFFLVLWLCIGTAAPASETVRWPLPGAEFTAVHLPPAPSRKLRVYLDAGHGAAGNAGSSSVFCEAEEVFTARVAEHAARVLASTGHFEVRLSRTGGQRPSYQRRVKEAERWRADAFVSLHSDARGMASWWEAAPGRLCLRNDDTPGFALLWSDDAPKELAERRSRLASAIAARMAVAGFLPYDGVDYPGLYDPLPATPGTFVDRHPPGARIYVLRRPKVPSVIVETHHGLDLREASRWREERTLNTFSLALAAGLVEALDPAEPAAFSTEPRTSSLRAHSTVGSPPTTDRPPGDLVPPG